VEDDSRKSILIVEDDAVIGSQEKRLLENAGYLTVHLLCGEDALERARNVNVPIDLILIDIDLGRGMMGRKPRGRSSGSGRFPSSSCSLTRKRSMSGKRKTFSHTAACRRTPASR